VDLKSRLGKEIVLVETRFRVGYGRQERPLMPESVLISTGGKLELQYNLGQTDATAQKPIDDYVARLTPAESGYKELVLECLVPQNMPAPEVLTLSLVHGRAWEHFCDVPLYTLWRPRAESFGSLLKNILRRRDTIGETLQGLVAKEPTDILECLSYNLPTIGLPVTLPFVKEEHKEEAMLLEQRKRYHQTLAFEERPRLSRHLSREERSAFLSSFNGKIDTIHKHCIDKKRRPLWSSR
jgi:hypothetical protein